MSSRVRSRAGGAVAALLALFLAALALRLQLVGAGPLIPEIGRDLGVSFAVAGLLTTIPVACMGLFALPAARLAGRFGPRHAIAACLAVIAFGGLVRAVAPGAALVLAATVPLGVAMGVSGALMPMAVKLRFAGRPAFASGVYTTGMNVGAALASSVAVPVAGAFGGWRAAFAVFGVLTVPLFLGWLTLTSDDRRTEAPAPPRLPWRRPIVWVLALCFGLQSIVYYGLVAWLAASFQERGWSDESAGALLGVFGLAVLPGGILVPWLSDHFGSRRQWLVASASLLLCALLGISLLPDAGMAWAVGAGIAAGGTFALAMTLPLDVAHSPGDVGAVAALMLCGGYAISSLGPFGLGAVRDATGSFTASLWVLVGIAVLLIAVSLMLSPRRLRPV
jgi:CP family cyanate transporter-like MFS transporter